jgi:hypothetical protein
MLDRFASTEPTTHCAPNVGYERAPAARPSPPAATCATRPRASSWDAEALVNALMIFFGTPTLERPERYLHARVRERLFRLSAHLASRGNCARTAVTRASSCPALSWWAVEDLNL